MSLVRIPSGPLQGVSMHVRERRLSGRLRAGLRASRRRRRTAWLVHREAARPSR